MPYSISVQLKVEDYAKWKAEFDGFAAPRKASGEKSYQIFRLVDDPNTLVLIMEYDSLDRR
jgi:quinol monooxygenase YgiN